MSTTAGDRINNVCQVETKYVSLEFLVHFLIFLESVYFLMNTIIKENRLGLQIVVPLSEPGFLLFPCEDL